MRLRYAGFLLIFFFAGCASLPRGPGCVKIGPAGAICLLSPAALPQVEARHIVTVEHDGEQDTFLGRLRIDPAALRLAGNSLFGTHLFTIAWDGRTIDTQPRREKMHPDLIVAMLQASLANPGQLRPHLYGMELTVKHDGDGSEVRELYERGHLVARIRKGDGPLTRARLSITIPPAHTHIRLDPLEKE